MHSLCASDGNYKNDEIAIAQAFLIQRLWGKELKAHFKKERETKNANKLIQGGSFMQYLKNVLGFVTILNLVACSPPHISRQIDSENDTGIVGGAVVERADSLSRSVVGIYLEDSSTETKLRQICTGTLIASDVILTAAHCVDDTVAKSASKFIVSFGNKTIKSKADLQQVKLRRGLAKRVHSRWDVNAMDDTTAPIYDIALLKIQGRTPPFGFKPVAHAKSKQALKIGDQILAYGFGLTMDFENMEPDELLKVAITIRDPRFSATHFETYDPGSSTCNGDSGGPAFLVDSSGSAKVVGVTSFGPFFCNGESYFTNVVAFSSWINSALKSLARVR